MNNSAHFSTQILFNNVKPSAAIENNAYKHAEKLRKYYNRILSCRVSIETHHHHNKGNIYHIRVDLVVPGSELVANRDLPENHAHEDAYVALRDAFLAITRQLKKYAEKQREGTKYHELRPEHPITEIATKANYPLMDNSRTPS